MSNGKSQASMRKLPGHAEAAPASCAAWRRPTPPGWASGATHHAAPARGSAGPGAPRIQALHTQRRCGLPRTPTGCVLHKLTHGANSLQTDDISIGHHRGRAPHRRRHARGHRLCRHTGRRHHGHLVQVCSISAFIQSHLLSKAAWPLHA